MLRKKINNLFEGDREMSNARIKIWLLDGDVMKAKKYWLMSILLVSAFLLLVAQLRGITVNEQTQISHYGKSTLSGLKDVRVNVTVSRLGEGAKEQPEVPSDDELQTDVEILLRVAGVPVTDRGPTIPTREESSATPYGTLFVTVDVMRHLVAESATAIALSQEVQKPKRFYVVHVSTLLYQKVILVRSREMQTFACTWPYLPWVPERGLTLAPDMKVKEAIKEDIKKQVNDFINDYLAANPKEPVGMKDANGK